MPCFIAWSKLTVEARNKKLPTRRSSGLTTLATWRPQMSTSEYANKKYSNMTWR